MRTRSHMRVLVIMTRHLSVRPDRPTPSLSSAARQRTFLSSSSPSSPLSSLATSAAVLHVQLVAAAVFCHSREFLRQLLELAKGRFAQEPAPSNASAYTLATIADRDGRRSSRCSSPASLRTLSDRSSLLSHELPTTSYGTLPHMPARQTRRILLMAGIKMAHCSSLVRHSLEGLCGWHYQDSMSTFHAPSDPEHNLITRG